MHESTPLDFSRIAQDLQIRKLQVEAVVQLLDEGNTIPYIARYRHEKTGGLSEEVLRQIKSRVVYQRQQADRKQTILKSIEAQGKLTEELRQALLKADTPKRVEDLYMPFKPRKKSQAAGAREKGLEPLALALWHADPATAAPLEELLPVLVNPERDVKTPEEVKVGVQLILAEYMAETAEIRAPLRVLMWETGKIVAVKSDKLPEGQGLEYKDFFAFSEPARQIPPQRIQALDRAEKDNAIKVKLEVDQEKLKQEALVALAGVLEKAQGKGPVPATPPPPPPANPQPEASPSAESAQPPSTETSAPTQTLEPAPAGADTPPQPELTPVPPPQPLAPVAMEPIVAGHPFVTPHAAYLRAVLDDALQRLILPSLEREIRKELHDESETHAVAVFAKNLRSLLMQPPVTQRRVLAIDPGFRQGCKVAALDEHGNLLDHATLFPFGGGVRKPREKSAGKDAQNQAAELPKETPAPVATVPPLAGEETVPVAPEPTPSPGGEAPPPQAVLAPEPGQNTGDSPSPAPASPAPEPAALAESSTPAPDKRAEAKTILLELVRKHQLSVVALGNGGGCREMEELLAELITTHALDLAYALVNEAGTGGYAAGPVGREEFPEYDAPLRAAISIGRRLQDPLGELVKIEPPNLGVGLGPQDLARRELREMLEGVVESCVNQVGVDLNSGGVTLLRYLSGLNPLLAREIVDYRKQHGPFQTRDQLLQVPGFTPERYAQAAGFVVVHGPNPLDRSHVHPEHYPLAEKILAEAGYNSSVVGDPRAQPELTNKLSNLPFEEIGRRENVSPSTVYDVAESLALAGRDPRAELPPPIFRKGLLKIEDLQAGMELKGTVLNVVDFGAFVDVGMKESGLVHISQMANRYIKSPHDVAAVNDIVTVWVLTVDKERNRVSLTMIMPGSERRAERRPGQRDDRREGPPRGRRPGGPPAGQGSSGEGRGRGPGRSEGPPRSRPGERHPGGRGQLPPGQRGPGEAAAATSEGTAPPSAPPPPPRKPRRQPPKPKLTQDALEGKVPLRTFGELSALFAAKKAPPQETPPPSATAPPAPPEVPATPPADETPANP